MASGVEVGRAYVTVLPNATGFASTLQSQVSNQVAPVGTSAGKDISTKLGDALKSGAMVVGGAAAATLGVALTKGWSRLTAIDTAKQKLLGLKMPAATVDKVMKNALNSVKGTAFGLGDAATVAASAVAAGVKPGKDLERTLKLVGDAAFISGSSLGEMGTIFNKVASTNKVQGEVLQQLGERGIPILQLLAKHLKISTQDVLDLSRKGVIGFDDFRSAIEKGMGGAALKSGETFQGAMDNVMASLGRMGANLLSGFFPDIKSGLGGLLTGMQDLEPVFKDVGTAAADGLRLVLDHIEPIADAAKWLAGILGTVLLPVIISAGVQGTIAWAKSTAAAITGAASQYAAHVKTVAGWVLSGAAAVKSGAETVAIWLMLKAEAIKSTAVQIAQLVRQAAAWTVAKGAMLAQAVASKAVAAAQWLVNAAMNANPIGLVILAITALVGAFLWLWENNEDFRKFWVDLWKGIQAVAKAVASWFTGTFVPMLQRAWNAVTSALTKLSNFFKMVWNGIRNTAVSIWSGIVSWISGIPARILSGLSALGRLYITMTSWIGQVRNGAIERFTSLLTWVRGLPGRILSALGALGSLLLSRGRDLVAGLASGITARWNTLRGWLNALPGRLVSAVGALGSRLLSRGRDLVAGLASGITDRWTGLRGWLNALPGRLVSAVGGLGSRLGSAGRDLVAGLWRGISNGYGWITGKIRSWVGNVVDFIKRVFGIGSPSTVLRDQVGRWLPEGIGVGIERNAAAALSPMEALAAELSRPIDPSSVTPFSRAGSGASSGEGAGDQFTIYEATNAAEVAYEIQRRQLVMRG